MRTIGNLPIPKKENPKYPFNATIQNETTTTPGTPVIEEIYGDILMNCYKLLKLVGSDATNTEDNDETQFQLIDALEKFPNKLNDLQQIMTVNESDIIVGFNFDLLPENYVFIGKITEDISASETYTLRGLGSGFYSITSNIDISASNLVLVVINSSGSIITSLSQSNALNDVIINTSFGSPLSFNESNLMYYISSGKILTDQPKSHDIQNIIQVLELNLDLILVDAIFHKGKLLAFFFDTSGLEYRLYVFNPSNLSTLEGEISFPSVPGIDNQPYMFCDGDFIYFTNSDSSIGSQTDDFKIGKFEFNTVDFELNYVSNFSISNNFEKTTNLFIDKVTDYFYTFIAGELYRYEAPASTRTFLGNFNTTDGSVFKFNNKTYYSNGDVGVKWNL